MKVLHNAMGEPYSEIEEELHSTGNFNPNEPAMHALMHNFNWSKVVEFSII